MAVEHAPEPSSEAWSGVLRRRTPVLLAAYAAGLLLLARAEVPQAWLAVTLSVVSWLAFTALLLAATAGLVAWPLRPGGLALALAGGALGWFGLSYGLGPEPPLVAGVGATLFMVVAMAALGRVLGGLFREASLLPPALVLAGVVDVWGVNQGVVAKVAAASPETIVKASATVPGVASSSPAAFALADLSIGPGDLAVAALVLTVVLRHGFDLRRNLIWMYGLTIAGLALALLSNWLVPGLVFIGAAGVVANWRRFTYTPAERRALVAAAVGIAVLLAAGTALLRVWQS